MAEFPPPIKASTAKETAAGNQAPTTLAAGAASGTAGGAGTSTETSPTGAARESQELGSKNSQSSENLDEMLDPLRENPIMKDFVARIQVDMKMLKAKGVKISDIACKMSLQDLVAGVDACGLKVFSGNVNADFHLQMKPKVPTYQMNAQVSGLNLSQAVDSQFSLFKNTVTGTADFKMSGQGASLNPDPAKKNLKVRGSLKVDHAVFATVT